MNQMLSNKVPHAAPSVSLAGLAEEVKCDRWTSHQQYESQVKEARANYAHKLIDAFESLEKLTDQEFLELMKTVKDGVTACDMLEKFRKWKGL